MMPLDERPKAILLEMQKGMCVDEELRVDLRMSAASPVYPDLVIIFPVASYITANGKAWLAIFL